MQAARLKALKADLSLEEVDMPIPGDDEVVIEQLVTGICYRDLLTRDGYLPRVSLPITPGHEISGTIAKTGASVQGFKKGDRVVSLIYLPCGKCEFCKSGQENLCPNRKTYGEDMDGGYARFVKVNSRSLVHVPDGVGEHEATISACVTGMLYHALKVVGNLSEGEKVLVTGAGGGVGVHAIQIAKVLGAEVIAETSSKQKVESLHRIGADHVVMISDSWDREVKKLTGDGVDFVLEAVGIHTFEKAMRTMNAGGRMVVVGNLVPQPVPLHLGLLILKGYTIRGSVSSTRDDITKVLDLSKRGKIKAISDGTMDLHEVNGAFARIKQKGNTGRVFLSLK